MPTAADAVVLDASAFVHVYTERTASADDARRRFGHLTVHTPHLFVAEVGSVARRLVLGGGASAERGLALIDGAASISSRQHPHRPLVRLAWSLRRNVSFYDALYVALAAALSVPLLTADARLARSPGLLCDVQLVD